MSGVAPMSNHPRPVAIAIAPGGEAHNGSPPSMPHTCVTCAKRKVKCDKSGPPCSTCRKSRHECYYEAPAPRKRKRKAVDDVHERLEHYESLLKQHGLLKDSIQASPEKETPYHVDHGGSSIGHLTPDVSTGRLLARRGKSRYLESALWRDLAEDELNLSSDEEDEREHLQAAMVSTTQDPFSAALFGASPPAQSLVQLHPTYDGALKLWTIFVSHVEPLTKTFHVPSGLAMVKRGASSPSSMSKATECLLFAIYHFAVVVMTEDQCGEVTGRSQVELRRLYHDATRQALINAHFLRTTDTVVLQAYFLFLLAVRNTYDPHTFWILTGIATRIAQRIGLHRDGDSLGLQPFEAEMRRRLFWQLFPLDGMAAQLSGARVTVPYETWDTRLPLNVNDEDLYPEMSEPSVERQGATDMIFCLARTELARFHHRTHTDLGDLARLWESGDTRAIERLETAVTELESLVESKFIRYCDFIEPIQALTMALAKSAISGIKLRIRLPGVKAGTETSVAEHRELFKLALKILDYKIAGRTNPGLSKYSWHLQALNQWEPLIWVLNELRKGPTAVVDYHGTWSRIEQVYLSHPEFRTRKRALNIAVNKLTLNAWDTRVSVCYEAEPGFIADLRTSLHRKDGGRTEATVPYNPWGPQHAELPMPIDPALASSTETTTVATMDNFNPDNIDWMFWDQLIQAPDALPLGETNPSPGL